MSSQNGDAFRYGDIENNTITVNRGYGFAYFRDSRWPLSD
jgi:hypothetical protein